MANVPTIVTPYVRTVENVAISAQETFQAIKNAVANCGLPDIGVNSVDLLEVSKLFSKSTKREHLRVTCDYTTYQVYVAQYAERYTIIGLRKYVDNTNNIHMGISSMDKIFLPRDIQNLRVKTLEKAILGAVDQMLMEKGERPMWTSEPSEIKMETAPAVNSSEFV